MTRCEWCQSSNTPASSQHTSQRTSQHISKYTSLCTKQLSSEMYHRFNGQDLVVSVCVVGLYVGCWAVAVAQLSDEVARRKAVASMPLLNARFAPSWVGGPCSHQQVGAQACANFTSIEREGYYVID